MKFTWEEKDLKEIFGLWVVKDFDGPVQCIEKYVNIVGFDASRDKNEGRITLTNIQDGMVTPYDEKGLLSYFNKENIRPLKLKEKIKILTENHKEF